MKSLLILCIFLFTCVASAQHSIGGMLFFTSADQEDIDTLIGNANTRAGGISTSAMGSALEVSFSYAYRFTGSMFEIAFQPSYFTQSSTGEGSDGGYNYYLNGFTFFPKLRIIPLENDFFKFFLQVGLGYGVMWGKINESNNFLVEFSGDRFGALGGIGAEFCFTASHCIKVEGNVRYMPIERNLVDSVSGTVPTGTPPSFSQAGNGDELEYNDRDFSTTFSGIMGGIGYTYYF